MTRASKTRSALFTSIISLLLCVSMLVGTTFAWFTDVAETGLNQIIAGNLDVALLDAEGETVEGSTELFTMPELWEPGAVAYAQIMVANVGNLDLQASMSINHVDVNSLNGHVLSEVLQYAVIDASGIDLTSREAVLEAAKTSDNKGALNLYDFDFELEPGEKSPLQTLVVYWEPNEDTVDNLYNANNEKETSDGKPLQIDLGVKVFATQLGGNTNNEHDSFGPDYDANITVRVADDSQLLEALGSGIDAVILDQDVTLPGPVEIIGDTTLDLNGNTLSVGKEKLLTVSDGATMTITNGSLNVGGENGDADVITVSNDTAGTTTALKLENVNLHFVAHDYTDEDGDVYENQSTSIVASAEQGAVEVVIGAGTNITFEGAQYNAPVYVGKNATVTMNGGTITANNTFAPNSGATPYGVMLDDDSAVFNMNGGVINVEGTAGASGITAYAGTVNFNGGVINVTGGNAGLTYNYYIGIETWGTSTLNLNGGTINVKSPGAYGAVAIDVSSNTTVNFNAAASTLTVTVDKSIWEGNCLSEVASVNALGIKVNTISAVSSSEEMDNALANAQAGDTIVLNNTTVEISDIPEGVTVAGNGAENTSINVPATATGEKTTGLVIDEANVTIKDVTLVKNDNISSWEYAGVAAVKSGGTTFDGVVINSSAKTAAIVVNAFNEGTVTIANSTLTSAWKTVHIVDGANGTIVIDNTEITGTYTFNVNSASSPDLEINVSNSKLHGWTSYSAKNVIFTNTEFSKGNSNYNVVAAYSDTTFENCNFSADFQAYAQVSGFTWTFNNCYKNGVLITAENIAEMFSDSDIWNKCTCIVNGVTVEVPETASLDSGKTGPVPEPAA